MTTRAWLFSTLILLSAPALAGPLQDSLTACRTLTSGPIPVTCEASQSDGTPVFTFAFPSTGSMDEVAIAATDVIFTSCQRMQIMVIMIQLYPDGRIFTRSSICKDGEVTVVNDWSEFKDTEAKKVGT